MLSGIAGCLVFLSTGLVLVTGILQEFHVAALSLSVPASPAHCCFFAAAPYPNGS